MRAESSFRYPFQSRQHWPPLKPGSKREHGEAKVFFLHQLTPPPTVFGADLTRTTSGVLIQSKAVTRKNRCVSPVSATCDLQASVRACEPTGVSETETGSSETPRKRKREASRAFKAKKKEREIWSLVFFFNHSTTKNTSITEKKKLYRKTKGSNHTHTPFAAGHFSLKKCNATENREQNTQTHAGRKQQHRIKMIPNKTN